MKNSRGITILGSTGSIGMSTLDVIERHPDQFDVLALSANNNVEKMTQQCLSVQPKYAVMVEENAAEQLQQMLRKANCPTKVLSGADSLQTIASLPEVDTVMAAIVGAAGLLPNLAAARAGKRVLLANKESLVMSGKLFMDAIRDNDAELLPIDSEHNAIFQSMPSHYRDHFAHVDEKHNTPCDGVSKILLTASGGPFRSRELSTLSRVMPAEAVAHPNWEMGKKISVDSATMMNKGLEVIEACWLFAMDTDDIQVVIHPQSTIHSMVSYIDGSVLAQLGNPDMRTPIAYSLAYPERVSSGVGQLDIFEVARLDFEKPDFERYPCLRLAFEAHKAGGYATIALNAANEIAVEAFLNNKIRFTDIPLVIENSLAQAPSGTPERLNDILAQDMSSRLIAHEYLSALS